MPTCASGTLRTHSNGRVFVKVEDHAAYGTRWVPRSWLVWWRYRKQKIPKGYDLHHKDENPGNDRLRNLALLTHADHLRIHAVSRHSKGNLGPAVWTSSSHKKASDSAKRNTEQGIIGTKLWSSETRATIRSITTARCREGKFGAGSWTAESHAKASASHKLQHARQKTLKSQSKGMTL